MIIENYEKNYLKSKDMDYVNKIVVSYCEQDTGNIIPSYKTCTIYGLVHLKQNGKDKNEYQKYSCFDCYNSFCDRTNSLFY